MSRKIDITLVILVVMVLIALAVAYGQGGWALTWQGVEQTGRLLETVWLRLLLGFTLGGMVQVVIPRAVIAKWLGPASGLKGILIGSYTAIIMGGPPYVMLPVVASFYTAGAGAGPIIALVTGHSLLGLQTLLAWQIPFLGVGIPLSKYIVSLFLTPLVGLAGATVFRLLAKLPDTRTQSGDDIANGEPPERGKKASRAANHGEKK